MWDSQDLAKKHAEDAQDVAKHAQDVAKHTEDGRGRCQACLGVAKQAYTSQVPTKVNADRKSNQILKWTPIVI